jgi:hypothetical protein
MEILINELSLTGQFLSISNFVENALKSFLAVLKELDRNNDVVLKKQNFWNCKITNNTILHSLVSQRSFETERIKLLFKNLSEPYWETSQKHNAADIFEYNENNIVGTSLAETCERDKIVISFAHFDFSSVKLRVLKNQQVMIIDNLFDKWHYSDVAYQRGQMTKCEYFDRKFKAGKIILLENEYRFIRTSIDTNQSHGETIYKEIKTEDGKNTERYWYLDNFHTQHEENKHYEVFNAQGNHIGEANLDGKIDTSKKDNAKTITI